MSNKVSAQSNNTSPPTAGGPPMNASTIPQPIDNRSIQPLNLANNFASSEISPATIDADQPDKLQQAASAARFQEVELAIEDCLALGCSEEHRLFGGWNDKTAEGMTRAYRLFRLISGNEVAYKHALALPVMASRLRGLGNSKRHQMATLLTANARDEATRKECSRHANILLYAQFENIELNRFPTWFRSITLSEAVQAVRLRKRDPNAPLAKKSKKRGVLIQCDVDKHQALSAALKSQSVPPEVQQIINTALATAEQLISGDKNTFGDTIDESKSKH